MQRADSLEKTLMLRKIEGRIRKEWQDEMAGWHYWLNGNEFEKPPWDSEGLWCWERLKVGGEGDNRGWDGWMTSLTQLTWVWVNSGSWWWTGKPGMLHCMGLQRVGQDVVTEQQHLLLLLWYFLSSSVQLFKFALIWLCVIRNLMFLYMSSIGSWWFIWSMLI